MRMTKRKILSIAAVVVVFFGVFAGTCGDDENKAQTRDRATAEKQLTGYQTNQPVPVFTWSQLRQNLIEIETAQAQTTQTTTFFFNQGVQDPVSSCPSIGFPIPSTYQITNPEAKVRDHDFALPQIEANGVYTDQSTGTYAICVDAQGRPYADYWEGFVKTVTGPAKWNTGSHQVELVGPPSFNFSKGKK
jgi:hypothetical protein